MKYFAITLTALLTACTTQAIETDDTPPLSTEIVAATTQAAYKGEAHEGESHASDTHSSDTHSDEAHDEPRPYDAEADAEIDVNHTLVAAKEQGKLGLLVFGANWCHDSRALAAHFETPRFQTLLSEHYEMTYVDVGQKNRNIELAQTFGVEDIVGTPTVFITNSDGTVLNLETAPTWRNAASREVDDVFEYFESFTTDSKASK